MMFKLYLAVLIALMMVKPSMGRGSSRICSTDTDCSAGDYCITRTGLCKECADCNKFNRLPSQYKCVKSPDQCGDCIKGFMHNPCASFGETLSCYYCTHENLTKPSDISIPSEDGSLFPGGSIVYIIATVVILFVTALIFATFIYKKTNFRQGAADTTGSPPNAEERLLNPPSYSQAISTAPLKEFCDFANLESGHHGEQSTEVVVFCRKESETTQAATVYRVPSCERRVNFIHDNNSDNGSDSSLELPTASQAIEEDENTRESNWTSNMTAPHDETNLTVALSEATGVTLITQPEEEEPAESAPPPKRIRIHEKVSSADTGNQNSQSSSVNVASRTAFAVDRNDNILNQVSSARNMAYNQRSSAQHFILQDASQSSNEDEIPHVETETNYSNRNMIIIIEQNMNINK